jgi:CRP-like cAMP-binding protein
VLDGAPRSATATAGPEGARVLCVEQEAFYEVMREQVELAEGLVRILSRRLREANESLQSATKSTAGSQAVGSRAVGSRAVGSRAVGSRAVGSRAVESQGVGSRDVGSHDDESQEDGAGG